MQNERTTSTTLCACGCGRHTFLARSTNLGFGHVAGEPLRFINGHNKRILAKHPSERFQEKVEKTATCWLWQGKRQKNGYGVFSIRGKAWRAHRYAYLLHHGRLPPAGLDLDHLCRVRHCVNPAHLEPVTRQENSRRGAGGWMLTHCKHGHAFDEKNTYWSPQGHRQCRTCNREREAAKRRRLQSA